MKKRTLNLMTNFRLLGVVFVLRMLNVMSVTEDIYTILTQRELVNDSFTIQMAQSVTECAAKCSNAKDCCSGQYSSLHSSCQLHMNCCPNIQSQIGTSIIRKIISGGNITYPRDCGDISPDKPSGIYRIYPDNSTEICVFCDMETARGGWTVFQRRFDGTVDFYREWNDYKVGFGNVGHEHWLGNDKIYAITSKGNYKLRIDLEDFYGDTGYAEYGTFSLGDEQSQYILHLGNYTGNISDDMQFHNNMKFSTKDRDYDSRANNCAADEKKGGWWYNSCAYVNLNGLYYNPITNQSSTSHWKDMTYDMFKATPYWHSWKKYAAMKKTIMMVKKVKN